MKARIIINADGSVAIFVDEATSTREAMTKSNDLLNALAVNLDLTLNIAQPEQHRHGPGYEHQHTHADGTTHSH